MGIKRHIFRVIVFTITAIYLLLSAIGFLDFGYAHKQPWFGYTGGFLLLLIAFVMAFIMFLHWPDLTDAKYKRAHQRAEEHVKEFRKASYEALLSEDMEPLEFQNGKTIYVIGSVRHDGSSYDYICALEIDDNIIPFRLQNPLILGYESDVPIVSLCATHIGFNLLELDRNRDFYPNYDEDIFKDKEFHGYKFSSIEEYENTQCLIEIAIKQLLLVSGKAKKPLAYCLEVCSTKAEHTLISNDDTSKDGYKKVCPGSTNTEYHKSKYRNIYSLKGFIEDAIYDTRLTIRIRRYIRFKDRIYAASRVRRKLDKGKEVKALDKNKADLIYLFDIEPLQEASEWFNQHGHRISSGHDLLQFYRDWIEEGKGIEFKMCIIRKLLVNNNSSPHEVLAMCQEVENNAIEEAGSMNA